MERLATCLQMGLSSGRRRTTYVGRRAHTHKRSHVGSRDADRVSGQWTLHGFGTVMIKQYETVRILWAEYFVGTISQL